MVLSGMLDQVIHLSPVSLAIALVAVLAAFAYFALDSRGLPPGPIGVPILGYYPFLDSKTTYIQLDQLKKKYGDVFSLRVSGTLYITLGTAKALREAHITKGDCFGSRQTEFCLFSHAFQEGVGFINGEAWKVLRKFLLGVLKERGAVTIRDSLTSGTLSESVSATIDYLRIKKEEEDLLSLLTDKCSSVLCRLLFGENGVTQEQVREICDHYAGLTMGINSANMLLTGNIARVLFSILPSTRTSMSHLEPMSKCISKIIEDHKSSYSEDHMRDLVDEYLRERNLRRSKGDPTAHYFTDKALVGTLVQFLGDGILGVAAFIGYFLKNIIERPEEQEKIYQELVEVVGEDRQPSIEDKSKLTYTNAFILEVLRTSDFFPLMASLQCTKETTLHGYRIPVGSVTLMNTWSVHFDPEVYQEPEKFNPSRFISKDGGGKRAEPPVTFGLGKRSCLGEGFVMLQVFLFLTSIVKNFRLTAKDPEDLELDVFHGKMKIHAEPRS